ncbi:hypothetical protein CDIK_0202 [Cucumispora dikerogammari]|nr:hypothetical protein CDIK_0202 [Cucumispora dikerogammari]
MSEYKKILNGERISLSKKKKNKKHQNKQRLVIDTSQNELTVLTKQVDYENNSNKTIPSEAKPTNIKHAHLYISSEQRNRLGEINEQETSNDVSLDLLDDYIFDFAEQKSFENNNKVTQHKNKEEPYQTEEYIIASKKETFSDINSYHTKLVDNISYCSDIKPLISTEDINKHNKFYSNENEKSVRHNIKSSSLKASINDHFMEANPNSNIAIKKKIYSANKQETGVTATNNECILDTTRNTLYLKEKLKINQTMIASETLPLDIEQTSQNIEAQAQPENLITPHVNNESRWKTFIRKIISLPMFSESYMFIWHLFSLTPLLCLSNKVLFTQMCMVSTLYRDTNKNYVFLAASVVALLFSKQNHVEADNYNSFDDDAPYSPPDLDYSKPPRQPVYRINKKAHEINKPNTSFNPTEETSIDPRIEEITNQIRGFDYEDTGIITVAGEQFGCLGFTKLKTQDPEFLKENETPDKIEFLDQRVRDGVLSSSRFGPVVVSTGKYAVMFFNETHSKIDTVLKQPGHYILVFYPLEIARNLARFCVSRDPEEQAFIIRNVHEVFRETMDVTFIIF